MAKHIKTIVNNSAVNMMDFMKHLDELHLVLKSTREMEAKVHYANSEEPCDLWVHHVKVYHVKYVSNILIKREFVSRHCTKLKDIIENELNRLSSTEYNRMPFYDHELISNLKILFIAVVKDLLELQLSISKMCASYRDMYMVLNNIDPTSKKLFIKEDIYLRLKTAKQQLEELEINLMAKGE